MRLLVPTICAGILIAPSAVAQTLQVRGVAGYLSEYELTADVSWQLADGGRKDFVGAADRQTCGSLHARRTGRKARPAKDSILDSTYKIAASLSYEGRESPTMGSFRNPPLAS
jgi:hypothetical protein